MPEQSSFKHLYLVSSVFVTVLVLSNIASSAKIVDLGFSFFSVPLVFDGGTLLFPLVYVLGDVLAEVYGFKTAKRVIWTGFAAMALAAGVFFLLGLLPAESGWAAQTGGDASYSAILGGISYGGIVIASLAAYLAGELSNAFILVKIKALMKGRPILGMLWVRTIGSTLVGELLDTVIFVLIATLFGVFSGEIFLSLVLTNYLLKCLIEILFTPFTYRICGALKRKEAA